MILQSILCSQFNKYNNTKITYQFIIMGLEWKNWDEFKLINENVILAMKMSF